MNLLKSLLTVSLLLATAQAQTDPTAAPAGTKELMTLTGVGVQIYACKDQAAGPAWTFVEPQAKLFDQSKETGTHSAGPTWTLKDGSWVKGQLLATKPSSDPNAIPWLLLKAADSHGPGALAKVAYVRRSDTVGGKAPVSGCDATHLGATHEEPYQAVYTFYGVI